MALVKRRKFLCFLLLLVLLLFLYIFSLQRELTRLTQQPQDFTHFNNQTGAAGLIVPNLVHFVHFDQKYLDFVTFVCILSAFYNQNPTTIYLHTNVEELLRRPGEKSRYLAILDGVLGDRLKVVALAKPTHVFGQQLASVHHASDVARIQILMKYGGIYLGVNRRHIVLTIKINFS